MDKPSNGDRHILTKIAVQIRIIGETEFVSALVNNGSDRLAHSLFQIAPIDHERIILLRGTIDVRQEVIANS